MCLIERSKFGRSGRRWPVLLRGAILKGGAMFEFRARSEGLGADIGILDTIEAGETEDRSQFYCGGSPM